MSAIPLLLPSIAAARGLPPSAGGSLFNSRVPAGRQEVRLGSADKAGVGAPCPRMSQYIYLPVKAQTQH